MQSCAFYAILILSVAGFIALMLYIEKSYSIHDAIRSALFQVIALITTTGFASDDYEMYPVSTHMVLFFFSLFYWWVCWLYCRGMKLFRILLIGKTFLHEVQMSFRPS